MELNIPQLILQFIENRTAGSISPPDPAGRTSSRGLHPPFTKTHRRPAAAWGNGGLDRPLMPGAHQPSQHNDLPGMIAGMVRYQHGFPE